MMDGRGRFVIFVAGAGGVEVIHHLDLFAQVSQFVENRFGKQEAGVMLGRRGRRRTHCGTPFLEKRTSTCHATGGEVGRLEKRSNDTAGLFPLARSCIEPTSLRRTPHAPEHQDGYRYIREPPESASVAECRQEFLDSGEGSAFALNRVQCFDVQC